MRRRRVDPAAGARAGALPEAIAALSRSLPSGPSPEIFRRAKFDRPEATSALWQLLFRVLSPFPAGNALASIALEVQARLVKSALCSQGYPRLALAQLPEDGSKGSRELLLALSWLLARGPVPEQMLAQTRVPLGDEMTVCQCEALASLGPPAPHLEAEGPVDVRHVQWLMGKLRFRWRQLVSSQQEQCALLSKLLRTLEHESRRLEAVLAWRRAEPVFWQWMARGCGRGPEWSAARRASRETVEKELGALQRCWEQDSGPAPAHGPHRLVRREDGAAGDRDLRAAELIRTLRSQEACLEAVLRQLQGQCRQELAGLAGALPGLIWIPPPGR
ncbi:tubulin epsilon and delta complex protein 1 isoform X9 [Macaca fascicularis]|uniref:tubulin epsilon and delta complex protein 1 isoform X9 n=1 Tax=Macaca fascicularis TaxID=9541 RepID=UPI003D154CDB